MTTINEIDFSDIYITPDHTAYIPDNRTPNGLTRLKADDFSYFFEKIEKNYDGQNPSYSILYNKILIIKKFDNLTYKNIMKIHNILIYKNEKISRIRLEFMI